MHPNFSILLGKKLINKSQAHTELGLIFLLIVILVKLLNSQYNCGAWQSFRHRPKD